MAPKATFTGGLFLFSLFFSCLLGDIFLLFPGFVLFFPTSWTIYRRYCDNLAAWWFRISVFFHEWVVGTKIVVYGEDIFKMDKETAIIIANHRTRLDWQFLWCLLHRTGTLHREKIVLKNSLKSAPGFGWAMQKFCFLFLHRRWEQDEAHITKVLNHYVEHDYNFQLLIFPEGTDLCPDNRKKSYAYAEKNNIPRLEYVMYPRVRGLQHTVLQTRSKVDSLYNITIGYLPEKQIPQSEIELLQLHLPNEIHFTVERIPIEKVPTGDVEMAKWINDTWAKKEAALKEFYVNGKFPGKPVDINPRTTTLLLSIGIWFLFIFSCVYALFSFWQVRWYAVLVIIIEVIIGRLGGSDNLEVNYHKTPKQKPSVKSE